MILFLILLGITAIWVIYYFANKSDKEAPKESEKPKEEPVSELKGTVPGVKKSAPPVVVRAEQESLDSLYAKTHDLWICRHCETLNSNASQYCIACGFKKPD